MSEEDGALDGAISRAVLGRKLARRVERDEARAEVERLAGLLALSQEHFNEALEASETNAGRILGLTAERDAARSEIEYLRRVGRAYQETAVARASERDEARAELRANLLALGDSAVTRAIDEAIRECDEARARVIDAAQREHDAKRERVIQAARRVTALNLDFDGVLTDNAVWCGADGSELVRCSRADSLGLAAVQRVGVLVRVISTETHPVVEARCRKLGVMCASGVPGVYKAGQVVREGDGLNAMMGNDTNDVSAMLAADLSFAPADARPEAIAAAHWVTAAPGGNGAVREVCDMILGIGAALGRPGGRAL